MTESKPAVSGCLVAAGVAGVLLSLLVVFGYYSAQRSQAEFERERQEHRLQTVADVKSGLGYVSILDAELLEMLLDDPQCVENVSSICFFMADLGDPRFQRVGEFSNLHHISFYDCGNADNVIIIAKDMPSIESLLFQVTGVSNDTLQSLTAFPNLKKVTFEQVMADETIAELNHLLPDVTVEAPFPASKEPEF